MTNFPIVLPHKKRLLKMGGWGELKAIEAKQKITAATSYPLTLISKYLLSGFKTSQLGVNEL